MTESISILGSTGSIGTQTLKVIDNLGGIKVRGISANTNVKLLEEQARAYLPDLCAIYDENLYSDLKTRLADTGVRVVCGMDGLLELASDDSDTVMAAMVGSIGLKPTLEAIKKGKKIALANKETLVTAGHIVMREAKNNGAEILPVDSEHSAIFQCLGGEKKFKKLLLTASGGPFFGKEYKELEKITAKDALRHPNWNMGGKITIDSATLMNKGLEVIEAKWLFSADVSQIEIVVQRESIIHSMVEFEDGAIIAQLGTPDMAIPIQLALTYPLRLKSPAKPIDFDTLSSISFARPDKKTFKCLALALSAAKIGGSLPTVMNAANEEMVYKFLRGEVKFTDIADVVERAMDAHKVIDNPSLDEIFECDTRAREFVKEAI